MRIIALDLGAHMAAATRDYPLDTVLTGSLDVSDWKGPVNRPRRLARTSGWLEDMFSLWIPEVVVYERPFVRGFHATRNLWGIAGVIEVEATRAQAAVVDATPGEIKAFSAGFGDAGKDAMTLAAQLMGYAGGNEHEADAVCLLAYAEKYVQRGEHMPQKKGQKHDA